MENPQEYQVNYWAGGENYDYQKPKPKRSMKRKLAIVISFILVLAITPSLLYVLTNLELANGGRQISAVPVQSQTSSQVKNNSPEVHKVIIEEPKTAGNQATVINNDSYWKISKRVCGEGKYYLSIQAQNGGKALYEGDSVTVNCSP